MFVTKFKSGDTTSVPQQTDCFYLHSFHIFIVVVAICGSCGESQSETRVIKHSFGQKMKNLAV